MLITIELYAAIAEAIQANQITYEYPENEITIKELAQKLKLTYPEHESLLTRCLFAINEEYADMSQVITKNDRIAIIPPVSGGAPETVVLTTEPLNSAAMHQLVIDPKAGAVVVFSGIVREFTDDRQTIAIEYTAHEDMAKKMLQKVIDECMAKWPIARMAIWHRLGYLNISETSVLIGVSTPHRKAAFEAAETAMIRIKQIVPIWKKEFDTEGQNQWGHSESNLNSL